MEEQNELPIPEAEAMENEDPICEAHLNELAIVEASEVWLRAITSTLNARPAVMWGSGWTRNHYGGISLELYQFSNAKDRNDGHIFHGNTQADLSFGDEIDADDSHKSKAVFTVHEAIMEQDLEDMMTRGLRMKHVGIGRTYLVCYSTQISKVVAGFSSPTKTLTEWLETKKPKSNAKVSIPPQVQQLIRTGYQAIEMIWAERCTSDHLDKPDSYHMIDDMVKIDPLRIRARNPGEDDMMPIRLDFGKMIMHHIHTIWEDDELRDLTDLLENKAAMEADIILGAPVLLLPARRELMYHRYYQTRLLKQQVAWLQDKAYLGDEWKKTLSIADPVLKSIIDYQEGQAGGGFKLNFKGTLHFASVVSCHYAQHFKTYFAGAPMTTRVDLVLKNALPRMLSKIYNSLYESQKAKEGAP